MPDQHSAPGRHLARPGRRWVPPALLVAVTFLAYSNTFQAPFVYDDVLAIPENPTIRKLWPITAVLLPHAEGGLTVSGRPVLNLSFALNYALSGTGVWSYHLFNVMIHAGGGLLLFGLVRRTLARAGGASVGLERESSGAADTAAITIAALWAVHPLQTQAVTYTVQRAESLMGFFYLLTLYAFVRGTDGSVAVADRSGSAFRPAAPAAARHVIRDMGETVPGGERHVIRDIPAGGRAQWGWLAVSVVACALGMGTKEVMATAPLLVLLYDRTFLAGTFAGAWRRRRGYYAAMFATWILLAALVLSTGGNRGGTVGPGVGVPWWAYPLTQFKAVAHYLGQTAWPSCLIFEYGTFWVARASEIVAPAVFVLLLLTATVVAVRPSRPTPPPPGRAAGFLGAAFFLILAPTSLAPGTIQMIVEHRMYLPLAAVLTGGVLVAQRWLTPRLATTIAVAAVLALAVITLRRNQDYRSHAALWRDTVAKRPDNPRAHEGLAEAWAEAGRPELALRERAESIRLRPDESTYHYNLGLTHMEAGQLEDAGRSFQQALRLAPTEPRTHNNFAIVLGRLGRTEEALARYADAVRLKPDEPQFHYNFGVALLRAGRVPEAIAQYEATVQLQPAHAEAHFNLGTALIRANRFDEAFQHYREALRLRPDDEEFRRTYAGALLLSGKPHEAEAEFRRLLAQNPRSAEAHFGLGNALVAGRQPDAAVSAYEAALRLDPSHANAHFKLGNVLLDLDRVPDGATHYEAAVRLKPEDAESHHNLGVAYARQERWSEARREFETALRLKPDYADARRNLDQLRALRGNE